MDSEASKAIAREEASRAFETNKFGQPLSGADKFNMGARYKNASLARWLADEKFQDLVNKWIKGKDKFLLIAGNPGTGKTYISAAILNLYQEQKREIFYTTQRRFCSSIQEAIGQGTPQYSALNKIAYKEILIFDDLGAGTNSQWQQEMILELIDIRYSQKTRTVFTTNLTREGLKLELGYRIASRLLDKENDIIELWLEDMRQTEGDLRF